MNNFFPDFNYLSSLTKNLPLVDLQKSIGIMKASGVPSLDLKTVYGLTSFTDTLPIKELQRSIGLSQQFSSNLAWKQTRKNLGLDSSWLDPSPLKELTASITVLPQIQSLSVIADLKKSLQPAISSLFSHGFSTALQQDFKLAGGLLTELLNDSSNDEYSNEEFETAAQEASVQQVVSELNANVNSPDQAMTYIVETLRQIQNTQETQNIRLDKIEKNTKQKPLAVKIIIWILLFVLQCYLTPVAEEYLIKPTTQAVIQAKHEILQKINSITDDVNGFITQYKFVCVDMITLHHWHNLKSRPVANLNFKSVVRVLGKYKKWNRVAYFINEDEYYIGWIQNYKLKDLR